MKRRDFIQTLSAAGLSPVVPTGLTVPSVLPSVALPPQVYDRAVYYARLWENSVPEMYTSAFGLDHGQAEQLFRRLVSDKVLAAPNGSGIARAVSPFFPAPNALRPAARTGPGPSGPSANPVRSRTGQLGSDGNSDPGHRPLTDEGSPQPAPEEVRPNRAAPSPAPQEGRQVDLIPNTDVDPELDAPTSPAPDQVPQKGGDAD